MKEAELALIARLRQGDQSAFDTLVRQHQKDLFRLAYRMTQNVEDAKDLSQEAFLRAYRGLGSFDGRSSLSTWLYRITMNLCLTHLRQHRSSGEEALPETYADPSPKSLDELEEREVQRAVAEAVAELPPQQRATRYPGGESPASNSNAAEFLLSSFLLARHLVTTVECYEKHAF